MFEIPFLFLKEEGIFMIALLVLLIVLLAGFALFTRYIDAGQSTGLHSSNYSNDALKRHYQELKRHGDKWKRAAHPFYHLGLKLGDDCYPTQRRPKPQHKAKSKKENQHHKRSSQVQRQSATQPSPVKVKSANRHHGADILKPDDVVVNADGEIKTSADITRPSYEDVKQESANEAYDGSDVMPLVDPSIVEIEEQSNALAADQAQDFESVTPEGFEDEMAPTPVDPNSGSRSQSKSQETTSSTPTETSPHEDTNHADRPDHDEQPKEPTNQDKDKEASWSQIEGALDSLLMNAGK